MTMASPQLLGALFGVSELGLLWWKRSRGAARSADGGSLRLLWIVILVSLALATAAAITVPTAYSPLLRALNPLAALLFLGGLVLRWYAIFYLGRLFTVNVAIAADHSLIDSGPYRWIRHPSYTGALLLLLALGISFGNWLSLVLAVLPPSLAFARRMDIEETALGQALGDSYRRYSARTRRLIPGLY